MWLLALSACVHAPLGGARALTEERALAALEPWVAPTPLVWRRTASVPAPTTLGFRRAGGALWAIGSRGGTGYHFARLDPSGAVLWQRDVMDADWWQVAADGSTVLVSDLLGCNVLLDAATGARRYGNPWVVDPYAFALDPAGRAVWSFDMDGRVVGWPLYAGAAPDPTGIGPAELGRFEVGEGEGIEALAVPRADRLLLVGERELVLRRLPDGALLGRTPLPEGASLCAAEAAGVGVQAPERAPTGWSSEDLSPLPAAPGGCARPRAEQQMYGWVLAHPGGPLQLGDLPFDVHLAEDGALWVVAEQRVERWEPAARPVRRLVLRDGGYVNLTPTPEVVVEGSGGRRVVKRVADGAVLDELWLTPPGQAEGSISVHQARWEAGTLVLDLSVGGLDLLVEVGGPPAAGAPAPS